MYEHHEIAPTLVSFDWKKRVAVLSSSCRRRYLAHSHHRDLGNLMSWLLSLPLKTTQGAKIPGANSKRIRIVKWYMPHLKKKVLNAQTFRSPVVFQLLLWKKIGSLGKSLHPCDWELLSQTRRSSIQRVWPTKHIATLGLQWPWIFSESHSWIIFVA